MMPQVAREYAGNQGREPGGRKGQERPFPEESEPEAAKSSGGRIELQKSKMNVVRRG